METIQNVIKNFIPNKEPSAKPSINDRVLDAFKEKKESQNCGYWNECANFERIFRPLYKVPDFK